MQSQSCFDYYYYTGLVFSLNNWFSLKILLSFNLPDNRSTMNRFKCIFELISTDNKDTTNYAKTLINTTYKQSCKWSSMMRIFYWIESTTTKLNLSCWLELNRKLYNFLIQLGLLNNHRSIFSSKNFVSQSSIFLF